jgi:lipopolysaccharide biosynthesis glycosyltransferase
VQHLGVMFVSLLENTAYKGDLDLYVIDGGISQKDKELLILAVSNYRCRVHFLDIKPELFERFPESPSASMATYFRIFVPELLDTSIEKVIYLDCDIVVLGDIEELWKTDVSEHFAAAAEDCGIERSGWYSVMLKRKLGMKRTHMYFNAGVLVMNLNKLRKHRISEKVRDFLLENPDKVEFADQDALNSVLCSGWLPISQVWNQQMAHCEFYEKGIVFGDDMENAVKNPKIVHYTSSYYIKTKPWSYMDMHPYKKEYYKYLGMTPWKDFTPSDYNMKNVIIKALIPTFAGKLMTRYIRFVKPYYSYDTSLLPKKLRNLFLTPFIYHLFFPFGYVYMTFFSMLTRGHYNAQKNIAVSGDRSIPTRLKMVLLLPARYLVYKHIRYGIREDVYTEKYTCPCCGYKTLTVKPPESNEVCEICNWEYDQMQVDNPDSPDGANDVSLNQARKNYLAIGASEEKYIYYVRKPGRRDIKGNEAVL